MAQPDESLDPVLLNTFLISNKRFRVYFRKHVLIWETEGLPVERETVTVFNIIAVDYAHGNSCNCLESRAYGKFKLVMKYLFRKWLFHINPLCAQTQFKIFLGESSNDPTFLEESTSNFSHNSLVIHYAKRIEKNKWQARCVTLQHGDPRQVSSWLKTLDNALKKQQRPRSFLVFVNPYCGKRKGRAIYDKTVKPILDLANVDTNVIVTEHGNHAKEIILSVDLDKYDGIVAVGGDGTVSEIMNALVIRTIRDERGNENDYNLEIPKIKIPVAIIPGGSTDCIAYCLNGTQDRKTAVIYAVLGDKCGLDICGVYSQTGLCRYFLSLLGYGFLGDVLKESDKYRWMGPKRYDYAGFLKVLQNKRYYCEVTMVLSAREAGVGPKCHSNCETCKTSTTSLEAKPKYQERNLATIRSELKLDLNQVKNPEKKVTVRGKYFIVGCANISCACERSPNGVAPHAHVGDGSMDVLLFKPQSVIDVLKLLIRSKSKNDNEALSDLPFIDIYKAREVSIRVLDKNMEVVNDTRDGRRCHGASVWNCDGEVILDSNVKMKNYRQLVQVFSRRSVPLAKSDTTSCFSCYNCSRNSINEMV